MLMFFYIGACYAVFTIRRYCTGQPADYISQNTATVCAFSAAAFSHFIEVIAHCSSQATIRRPLIFSVSLLKAAMRFISLIGRLLLSQPEEAIENLHILTEAGFQLIPRRAPPRPAEAEPAEYL